MMKKTMNFFFLLILAAGSVGFSAEKVPSQSGPTGKPQGFHVSIGAGVAIKNNMRKDNTYNNTHGDVFVSPIPLIQIGWGPLSLGGQGLKADLYGTREWGIYTNIDRVRERYKGTDMDDRRDSWFWGAGGRYGKFAAYFAKDIQGRSHGKKMNLNYAEMYLLRPKVFTRSAVGVECFDQNYADYYYGVKASEVRAGRPEYHPKRFCQPTLSFAPMYKMDEKMTVMTALSVKALSKEVRRSPTVRGGTIESGLIFGALYQF